jgi:cysteine desulfurase
MRPYLDEHFGNPSSSHIYGKQTKEAVEKARKQVANLLNCDSSEIVFTSGGTESNNYALRGIAFANKNKGNHIITSSVEHPAIIEVCKYLETQGFEITYLPVDEFGLVQIEDVEKAIRPSTILITIMHANNEVGSIQPIAEIGALAKKNGVFMHTDAAQSLGKIKADVQEMNVDLLSIAGHKLYAPKGIGALYIRKAVVLEKLIYGADHESDLRAGTENVLEIVGLGEACEIANKHLEENAIHYREMRDLLYQKLNDALADIKLNGHPEKRLPNTLNLSFPNIEANALIAQMNGVAASAGAACHSSGISVSQVLKAMVVPMKYAMGTIRFSTGRYNTEEEMERAANEVVSVIEKMR